MLSCTVKLSAVQTSIWLQLTPKACRFELILGGAGAGNVTLSKVVGSVWSYDRQLLCPPFEALCTLDSDALMPTFACQVRAAGCLTWDLSSGWQGCLPAGAAPVRLGIQRQLNTQHPIFQTQFCPPGQSRRLLC